jgi:L-arabinokinase
MWHYDQPADRSLSLTDVSNFITVVNSYSDFFNQTAPIYVGRAPGRLDLMGGIADYSGSLVLELPLGVATRVAAQAIPTPQLEIFSPLMRHSASIPLVKVSFSELFGPSTPYYQKARNLFYNDKQRSWAAYLAGVLLVLHHEYKIPLRTGVRLLVGSGVPVGKGLSSSAALEVATLQALMGLYGLELSGREMALLCQQAENLVVGAPCGVMDQMTVACGQKDHLLALLCQPAELQGNVKLPSDIQVWGLDSDIRHAVSGADYVSVRTGAFMGHRIIAERLGMKVRKLESGRVQLEGAGNQAYLANITPSEWEQRYRDWIPTTLSGAEFLERWGGTTDVVTEVQPSTQYAVCQPTAHPIYEHQRVKQFRTILEQNPEKLSEADLLTLGRLMYESHQSYSKCGMGSSGTDRLVELVQQAGPAKGLYGAKITGGGSGGTVAVLGLKKAAATIHEIVTQYEHETGRTSMVLTGSSAGAAAHGAVKLTYS